MFIQSDDKEDFISQASALLKEPTEDKVEITRLSFSDDGEVWYKIPSGFPGMTILVIESAVDGVYAQLVREDGTISVAGE